MSFLDSIAKKNSVPTWFLKAHKEGVSDEEILSRIKQEVSASDGCRANPELWNEEMVTSFASFLKDFYYANIKANKP